MKWTRRKILPMLVGGAAVLGLDVGALDRPAQAQKAGGTVVIPADSYDPPDVEIEAGATVIWTNKDSDKHTATSMAGTPESFSVPAYPGKAVTYKFTKPGVYPYYCLEHATVDTTLRRAVARKESDVYPIAMEGIIVVKGPGLSGAPSAAITISGGNYAPDIVVVQAGGKVTWTNQDGEEHAVAVQGQTEALPAGKSQTVTFAKPGIYLFHCARHATFDSKLKLAAANKGAHTYPVSEEGFVIVL